MRRAGWRGQGYGGRGRGGGGGGGEDSQRCGGRGRRGVIRGEERGRYRGRGSSRRGREAHQEMRTIQPVGAKLLEEKIDQYDPQELLLWLTADRGVEVLLGTKAPRDDSRMLLLAAVGRACMSERSETLNHLLISLRDSEMFKGLSEYLATVYIPSMNMAPRQNLTKLVENLLELLSYLMTSLPTDSANSVSLLLPVIETRIMPTLQLQRLKGDILRIKEMVEDTIRSKAEGERSSPTSTSREKEDESEPPDDFRQINIVPTVDDLNNFNPFLRRNKIDEKFKSLDSYLDIQFRLLREDFVRPLREGIKEFKEDGARNSKDIKIYHGVRILFPDMTPQGITHQIQFNLDGLRSIRWEHSKRLIYGSLVCFSADGFSSLLFGTIANRDAKSLKEGRIDVFFQGIPESELSLQKTYTMVESSTYFEAYRHILSSLQAADDDLPFQQYLLGASTTHMLDPMDEGRIQDVVIPLPPKYLKHETAYDITPLMKSEFVNYGASIRIRADSAWPADNMLALDDSQAEAVRACLTQQLAVVQGPPGTGKTFIGLKVAEVLLLNSEVWSRASQTAGRLLGRLGPPKQNPILVLCYTNHALDQFLEGISSFEETNIVRVGSRSKNEALEKFNLNNLRRRMREAKELPRDIHANIGRVKADMRGLNDDIMRVSVMMEATEKHVLSESELVEVLTETEMSVLESGYYAGVKPGMRNRPRSFLGEWLGLGSRVCDFPDQGPEPQISPQQTDEKESGEEEIDVEDEALLEQERRVGEDEEEVLDHLKRGRRERETKLRSLDLALNLVEADAKEDSQEKQSREWQMSKAEKKKRKKMAKMELGRRSQMSDTARKANETLLWSLPISERWKLYRRWVHKYKLRCQRKISNKMTEYNRHARVLAEVKEKESLFLMRRAKVVGMTTTGAAKLHNMLRQLQPSIIIVEEAAEVLEAHIVASLTPSCQHLILIGDHQQLRPNPTVYELARNYNLDVSLFERLIKNRIAFSKLEIQHRMRPEISKLLVPHIYSELQDHDSVFSYPTIRGIQANMYFVDHNKLENEVSDGNSKVNDHEASFLVEFCRYLIKQEYKPSQITILTTYSGQLFAFKKKMPKEEFQGVRVSTVDNYQGEENDIILLSLVRSNIQGSIGFLSIDNRVCVALSRARHAFYCIGNLAQLCSKSVLWKQILTYVQKAGLLGTGLKLMCQQHPTYSKEVGESKDFRNLFPEGGCTKPCNARLDCGHVCRRSCHTYDPRHQEYKCLQKCGRVRPACPRGHPCNKPCSQPCGPCPEPLKDVLLPKCGHTQDVRCGDDLNQVLCLEKCTKTRSCGHTCLLVCGVDCHNPKNFCLAEVTKKLPCGHHTKIPCHASASLPQCKEPCKKVLDCGHACSGNCHTCDGDRLHQACTTQDCSRPLICGHVCKEPCGRPCLCRSPCQTACAHSTCPKRCGEPCEPCQMPCARGCQHGRCNNICSSACSRDPCDKNCPLLLSCGHPCIGICGEPCPDKCAICHSEDPAFEVFFGPEDEENARFIQLVDCGHLLHAESIDTWVEEAAKEDVVRLPECPKCKTPIRKTLRFNSQINVHLEKVEKVKAKLRGEVDARHKDQVIIAIRDEAREQFLETKDDGENVFDKEQIKWMGDLMRKVIASDFALGVQQLSKCQQLLQSLYIVLRLKQQPKPKKLEGEGLNPSVSARRLQKKMEADADRLVKKLVSHLMEASSAVASDQQMKELLQEVTRLQVLGKLISTLKEKERNQIKLNGESVKVLLSMEKILTDIWRPFNRTQEKRWKELTNQLKETMTGLGISEVEKRQVVAAMGPARGHWYSCPNGHVYNIGDCGGATVEANCPDCHARIGGTGHRLLASNRAAGHMDASTPDNYSWGLQEGQFDG